MAILTDKEKELFDKYFLGWSDSLKLSHDMRAVLIDAILSYEFPVKLMKVFFDKKTSLKQVIDTLIDFKIPMELIAKIDVVTVREFEADKANANNKNQVEEAGAKDSATDLALTPASASPLNSVLGSLPKKKVVLEPLVLETKEGGEVATQIGTLRPPSTLRRTGTPLVLADEGNATVSNAEEGEESGDSEGDVVLEADVDKTSALKKKGGLASLKEKATNIAKSISAGKKEKGSNFLTPSRTTRPNRFGGGSLSGKGAKIGFIALAVLILLISAGVLWRLGNENGEYNSSDNSSATSLGLSTCTTADGLPGVIRYNVTPNAELFGLSGFVDSQRTLPYVNSALAFEQGKSYQAIIAGENYRVGLAPDVSVFAPVSSFTQTGSECVQELAVEVLTRGIENQQRASVQLAYKIDFSHWSGLLVVLSLISILGFTAITLFMSGGKIKDFVLMVVAVGGTGFFVSKSDWEPLIFFLFYFFMYILSVALGSKSELQEQSDSFNAGNQLRLPQSMETLFKSLSRGWGIVGGYDWSQSAIYSALMMFIGAVYPSASPLVRAFDSQIMAIGIGGLFVVFSCAMEAWRRGLLGDWIAFALGFIGLLDFGIYYSAFGSNPPNIFDFSPAAVAVLGWTATFIIAVLANFGAQATSERTELQRDRMADGMLFFSAMKLVAVLGYIFYYLM
jgi:hypothetical protein